MSITLPTPLQSFALSHQPARTNGPKRKLFKWTDEGLELSLDWSSLETFLGCNKSALWKLIYSRQATPGAALAFGAAMHAALEVWYKLQVSQPDLPHDEKLRLCFTAIEVAFSEFPTSILSADYRTPDYCYECFLRYLDHYKGESFTPASNPETNEPLVEFSFSMQLGEVELSPTIFDHFPPGTLSNDAAREDLAKLSPWQPLKCRILWTGIIDLIADLSGSFWVADHKTTSILGEDFFSGFNIAMQPIGYVLASKLAFPHLDIQGFLLNVLACRKPTKTGKSFEPHRALFRYSQWHFDEWKADVLALSEEFLANLTSNFFPRKTQWCIGKYGKCRYFDVCSLEPAFRLDLLHSDQFVDNTWKPVGA